MKMKRITEPFVSSGRMNALEYHFIKVRMPLAFIGRPALPWNPTHTQLRLAPFPGLRTMGANTRPLALSQMGCYLKTLYWHLSSKYKRGMEGCNDKTGGDPCDCDLLGDALRLLDVTWAVCFCGFRVTYALRTKVHMFGLDGQPS